MNHLFVNAQKDVNYIDLVQCRSFVLRLEITDIEYEEVLNVQREWEYDDYSTGDFIEAISVRQGVAASLAVIKLILNKFVIFCAVCPCLQKNKCKNNSCLRCCRCLVEGIGNCFIYLWALGIIGGFGIYTYLMYFYIYNEDEW